MTYSTSDKILECAHALLIEVGYDGLNYAAIAERLAIARTSIRHHFPTKAHLVLEVVRRYRRRVESMLEQQARLVTDQVQRLQAYAGYWSTCIEDRSMSFCICALLAMKSAILPAAISAEITAHFKALAAWLEEVLALGAVSGQLDLRQPVSLEAQCFMAQIHASLLTARALNDPKHFSLVAQASIARLCGKQTVQAFR